MMAVVMSVPFPRSREPTQPPPLEANVVARCRAQDPMAFRAFVVRHERMVFALLSRMLGGRSGAHAEVEDLAQETFVRAFRAFPDFDPAGPAKLSTWLLTIATRLALDARKKRHLESVPLEEDHDRSERPSNPELSLERRQLGDAIAHAASELPDDQRAALVLVEMHGLSMLEMAEALGVGESTAKTKLFRAREKMRAALGDWRKS